MSFTGLLNRTCNIQRKTLTADGRGGATSAWANVYTSIPCRISTQSGQEKEIYARETNNIFRNMYIEYSANYTITEQDRVVSDSITWDIASIETVDSFSNEHHQKIVIRRLK